MDSPRHWVAHLNVLRDIQDRTDHFTEFVPLPFVHQNSPVVPGRCGIRAQPSRQPRGTCFGADHVYSRISHIQTSWVKQVRRTQVMLEGGANDLGGTLMEETIRGMGRFRTRIGQDRRRLVSRSPKHRARRMAHYHIRPACG